MSGLSYSSLQSSYNSSLPAPLYIVRFSLTMIWFFFIAVVTGNTFVCEYSRTRRTIIVGVYQESYFSLQSTPGIWKKIIVYILASAAAAAAAAAAVAAAAGLSKPLPVNIESQYPSGFGVAAMAAAQQFAMMTSQGISFIPHPMPTLYTSQSGMYMHASWFTSL